MPLCFLMSPAFISGTTRGTLSSIRKALELSITTQPALTAIGANSRDTLPPALKIAISTPLKLCSLSSSTAISFPRKVTDFPAERLLAKRTSFPIGKFLCSSTLSTSSPTAPVAPTMANVFINTEYQNVRYITTTFLDFVFVLFQLNINPNDKHSYKIRWLITRRCEPNQKSAGDCEKRCEPAVRCRICARQKKS